MTEPTLKQVVRAGRKLKQNSNLPVKFSARKKQFVTDYDLIFGTAMDRGYGGEDET